MLSMFIYFGAHAFLKGIFIKHTFFAASISALLSGLLLSGCSNLSLRTNAGEIAIGNATVKDVNTYTLSEMSNFRARFLGDVTTSYCETSLNPDTLNDIPSLSSLIKSLKLQVAQRGGNAIVMKQCGKVSYPVCSVYLECTGEAYVIDRGF